MEKFTDADEETGTVKNIETEETVSESHIETKKSVSASWVHFDNLKGEYLKSFNYYFEFLNQGIGFPFDL